MFCYIIQFVAIMSVIVAIVYRKGFDTTKASYESSVVSHGKNIIAFSVNAC